MYNYMFLPTLIKYLIILIAIASMLLEVYIIYFSSIIFFNHEKRYLEFINLAILFYINYMIIKYKHLSSSNYIKTDGFENLTYFFPIAISLIIFFVIRNSFILYKYAKIFGKKIGPFSIVETINTLDDGILLINDSGRVILINYKMKDILNDIFAEVLRNGKDIWKKIENFERRDITKINLENKVLIRFEDKTLEFTNQEFKVKNKKFYQILAINITEKDKKFQEVSKHKNDILKQIEILKNLEKDISAISEEETKLSLKIKLHDNLGSKLSMLQSFIKSKNRDLNKIGKINLSEILENDFEKYSNDNEKVMNLINFYKKMGIKINIKGNFPENINILKIYSEIIQETFSNAIIHSNADEINLLMKEEENHFKISISNNGTLPNEDINEGGGISGIRHKIFPLNGALFIKTKEKFEIVVLIPKTNNNNY